MPLSPLSAHQFCCRSVLAGCRWARQPHSLSFRWSHHAPWLPCIVMLMCSKLCTENLGFSCIHSRLLSILSVPSIVIVIRVVILDKQPKKKIAHINTPEKKTKVKLQVKRIFYASWAFSLSVQSSFFLLTFSSWLRLSSVTYFITNANTLEHGGTNCSHTNQASAHMQICETFAYR